MVLLVLPFRSPLPHPIHAPWNVVSTAERRVDNQPHRRQVLRALNVNLT